MHAPRRGEAQAKLCFFVGGPRGGTLATLLLLLSLLLYTIGEPLLLQTPSWRCAAEPCQRFSSTAAQPWLQPQQELSTQRQQQPWTRQQQQRQRWGQPRQQTWKRQQRQAWIQQRQQEQHSPVKTQERREQHHRQQLWGQQEKWTQQRQSVQRQQQLVQRRQQLVQRQQQLRIAGKVRFHPHVRKQEQQQRVEKQQQQTWGPQRQLVQRPCGQQWPLQKQQFAGVQEEPQAGTRAVRQPEEPQQVRHQRCLQRQRSARRGDAARHCRLRLKPHTCFLGGAGSRRHLPQSAAVDAATGAATARQQQREPAALQQLLHSPQPLQQDWTLQQIQQQQKLLLSSGRSVVGPTRCCSSSSALRSALCTPHAGSVSHLGRAAVCDSLRLQSTRSSTSSSKKWQLLQQHQERPSRPRVYLEGRTTTAWVGDSSSASRTVSNSTSSSSRIGGVTCYSTSSHPSGRFNRSGCSMDRSSKTRGTARFSGASSSGSSRPVFNSLTSGSSRSSNRMPYDGPIFCNGSSSSNVAHSNSCIASCVQRRQMARETATATGAGRRASGNISTGEEGRGPVIRNRTTKLRIGSRRSPLAMAQARQVVFLLSTLWPSEFPGAHELVQQLLQRKQQLEATGDAQLLQADWLGSLLLPHEEQAAAAALRVHPTTSNSGSRASARGDNAAVTAPGTNAAGERGRAAGAAYDRGRYFSPWGRLEYGELLLVPVETSGDRLQQVPLALDGGKGLFTKELDVGLQQQSIDVAVHSMKDVPSLLPRDTVLAAFLPREDPRDVLLFSDHCCASGRPTRALGLPLLPLPRGAAGSYNASCSSSKSVMRGGDGEHKSDTSSTTLHRRAASNSGSRTCHGSTEEMLEEQPVKDTRFSTGQQGDKVKAHQRASPQAAGSRQQQHSGQGLQQQQQPPRTEQQDGGEQHHRQQLALLQSLPWAPLIPHLPTALLTYSSPAGQAAAAAAAATAAAATTAAGGKVEDAADAAGDAAAVAAAAVVAGAAQRMRSNDAHSRCEEAATTAAAAAALPPVSEAPPPSASTGHTRTAATATGATAELLGGEVGFTLPAAAATRVEEAAGRRQLQVGLRVGTCSLRRQALLASLLPYPLLSFVGLRGNVHTRMKRLQEGKIDATLLAAAGLRRLGLLAPLLQQTWSRSGAGAAQGDGTEASEGKAAIAAAAERAAAEQGQAEEKNEVKSELKGVGAVLLPPWLMIPSVCQGIVGVQCRASDTHVRLLLQRLDCYTSRMEASCERAFLAALDGSCRTPIAGVSMWGRRSAAAAAGTEEEGRGLQDTAGATTAAAPATEIATAKGDCNEVTLRRLQHQEQRRRAPQRGAAAAGARRRRGGGQQLGRVGTEQQRQAATDAESISGERGCQLLEAGRAEGAAAAYTAREETQQLQFHGALATPDGLTVFKAEKTAAVSTQEEAAAVGREAGMQVRTAAGQRALRDIQRQVTENAWATAASTIY